MEDLRIFLYTVEDDPVCEYIKNKLNFYNFAYIELDFETIRCDSIPIAPYMAVMQGLTTSYYYSLEDILAWIKEQVGDSE